MSRVDNIRQVHAIDAGIIRSDNLVVHPHANTALERVLMRARCLSNRFGDGRAPG